MACGTEAKENKTRVGMSDTDIIRVLPYHLSNQIAAGEVVQRPSSALKELLENSLDAGATEIQILLEEGGKQHLQVIDNGSGMGENDAYMCFERHATSKMVDEKDLREIHTLGFRGEALASISSVAQVHLRTKREQDDMGHYVHIEGSKVRRREPIVAEKGTNMSIKNLFYNTPARKNFLGSSSTEMKHLLSVFQALALSHPDVAFSLMELRQGKNRTIHKLQRGKLSLRVCELFGRAQRNNMVPVEENNDLFQVKGYVGTPSAAKRYRGEQFFFVNQRHIKSGYLHHAVLRAYEHLLPEKHHPFYVLFFDLAPDQIDVNIHPAKTEVKFRDEHTIYQVLAASVAKALAAKNVVAPMEFSADPRFEEVTKEITQVVKESVTRSSSPAAKDNETSGEKEEKGKQDKKKPQKIDNVLYRVVPKDKAKRTRNRQNLEKWQRLYGEAAVENQYQFQEVKQEVKKEQPKSLNKESPAPSDARRKMTKKGISASDSLFQWQNDYLVWTNEEGVHLIHHLRARERVLYERLLKAQQRGGEVCQKLLFPQTIYLEETNGRVMEEVLPKLTDIGFQISVEGAQTFLVKGVPISCTSEEVESLLLAFLQEYQSHRQGLKLSANESLVRALAKRFASSAQNKTLEPEEQRALLEELNACKQPYYTPDGLPVFRTLELADIQQGFGRGA